MGSTCTVPGCDAPARPYAFGPRCAAHGPTPPPRPPVGTTAAELLARADDAAMERAARARAHIPREHWTVWGTPCVSDHCSTDHEHDHGPPVECSASCPCHKRPDLWRSPIERNTP